MDLIIGTIHRTRILFVTPKGELDYEKILSLRNQVLSKLKQENIYKVLCNLDEMKLNLNAAEIMQLQESYEKFRKSFSVKIAFCNTKEKLASQLDLKFYSQLAVQRGYQVRLFGNQDEALEWLKVD